jgi:hypothetical protein
MATIHHFGPYDIPIPGGLAPGQAYSYSWGDAGGTYDNATINVTGHPWALASGGSAAVYVSDMSIGSDPVFGGPARITAYATFGNDGSVTINTIRAFLTVTQP